MNIHSIYTIKKIGKQELQNILYLNIFQVYLDLEISFV